ncbi:hypothetical protein [Photobacterium atrarenae]|uniref:Uncharacterized protein n=1 Tax=Photobacterium atrarenae TaxID=865757 RepID=A0ABY5GLI4_9GAMM|nr:hypothetical protein [Photobacterium atrarenae]UTV30001.1 hypothetical protein NNL38_23690 [Photobacterium atrarenae]
MAVYTLVLEYDGATYLSQVESSDEQSALHAWCEELDVCTIDGFPLTDSDALLSGLADLSPAVAGHLTNVWTVRFAVGHDVAVLHLIKTDLSRSE